MDRCFYPHSFEAIERAEEAKNDKQRRPSSAIRRRYRRPACDEQPAFIKSMAKLDQNSINVTTAYFCYEKFLKEDVQMRFDWSQVPFSCTAKGGRLPKERIHRKTIQIENMIELCIVFLNHLTKITGLGKVRVVEFCAGSGFVLLPLAAKFPDVQFVLLDWKEPSVQIGRERIREASLNNVDIFVGDVRSYNEGFHLGIALHACGFASDLCLQSCISSGAAFVCAPCCIGKILLFRHEGLSLAFKTSMNKEDFKHLVKAGDFGHSIEEVLSHGDEVCSSRRKAKSYVEEDRRLFALENKYNSYITTMFPKGSTPKDDIIVGWPNYHYVFHHDRCIDIDTKENDDDFKNTQREKCSGLRDDNCKNNWFGNFDEEVFRKHTPVARRVSRSSTQQ